MPNTLIKETEVEFRIHSWTARGPYVVAFPSWWNNVDPETKGSPNVLMNEGYDPNEVGTNAGPLIDVPITIAGTEVAYDNVGIEDPTS